ncbi:hypothetical protein WNY37_15045 [Henriciella sp. AS95]|uniref:hypothetical protein n=1 Tax=Henriciella sp. AS95 TaxID=3135782 RepID=UPI003173947E
MTIALLTLLHILIPVYWLGGDLGAFYGSSFMVDPKRTVPERMLALKILNDIDMAPRTALILALPTGFTLAATKGWLAVSPLLVALVWVVALVWLALAWAVHLSHGGGSSWTRPTDLAIRYVVIVGTFGTAIASLAGLIDIPLFIALKLIALGICICLGLFIRMLLAPLGPAIVSMKTDGPSPQSDAAIAGVISRTRPAVLAIWVAVLAASYFGIAMPL